MRINLNNNYKIRRQSIPNKMIQPQPTPSAKKSAFLLKTYEILQNPTYASIVSWHHDSIGFVIGDVEKFTNQILPAFFKHSNFTSFIRQLNMYGFSKKRSVRGQNYYYHPKFCRDQKDLISEIYRKVEKKSNKRISEAKMEPVSQHKISSELSIQLECKQQPCQLIAPKFPQSQQHKYDKLRALLNANESLLQIQTNSLYSILSDISSMHLSSRRIHHEDDQVQYQSSEDYCESMSKMIVEYVETHRTFLRLAQQKLLSQVKQQHQHQQYKQCTQSVVSSQTQYQYRNSATSVHQKMSKMDTLSHSIGNTNHRNVIQSVKTEQTLKASNNNICNNSNNLKLNLNYCPNHQNIDPEQDQQNRNRKPSNSYNPVDAK